MTTPLLFGLAGAGVLISLIARVFVTARIRTDTDEWQHLAFAREVKKRGYRMADFSSRFVAPVQGPYPPLVHFMLAPLIGIATPVQIRLVYLTLDLVVAALIYGLATGLGAAAPTALFASLLYLVTPLNAVEGTFLNARSPGLLFYMTVIAALAVYAQAGGVQWIMLAAAMLPLVALTHRMALQVLLPTLAVSGAMFWLNGNATVGIGIFGVILIGMALAFLFTQGAYARVLRFHLQLIQAHAKATPHIPNPLHTLGFAPWLLLGGYAAYTGHLLESAATTLLIVAAAVPLVLAIFWWFGDGARHIYYATPPLLVLALPVFYKPDPLLELLMAAILLVSILLQMHLFRSFTRSRLTADLMACYDFLGKKSGLLLCLPTHRESVTWFTTNPIVYCQSPYRRPTPEAAEAFLASHMQNHPVQWVLIEKDGPFDAAAKKHGLDLAFSAGRFGIYKSRGKNTVHAKKSANK